MKTFWISFLIVLVLSMSCHASFNLELSETFRWKGQFYDLAIQDNLLFLANKLGIEIYSIEDIENPVQIGYFLTDGLANGVALNLPYVYVGDVYGFSVWDLSDIDNPVRRGGFKSDTATGYQERLYYRDGLVYVAAYTSGIQIIDVNDPDKPKVCGATKTNAYAWDLVLTEDAAFVMDFFSMSIVDIRRPFFPVTRVNVDAMFANGAAARDNLLYLGYVDGLRIMDISDPFNPVDVSDIGPTGSGTAETVALNGNYAYVGHGSYIEVYDISDPADPIQISYFYPPGHPRKVLIHQDTLFTILDDNGFLVTDISDPCNPVNHQQINSGIWGTRNDVTVKDRYVYLSDWNRGLVIYDTEGSDSLTELSNYSVPGSLRDFVIINDIAWLVCQSEIQAVDISDRTNPVLMDQFQTTGSPQNIEIVGDRLYMCDLYGLYVLDISNPGDIIRVGAQWLAKEGNPYDIIVQGNYGFVANGWKGMTVVDLSDETDPEPVLKWPGDNSKSFVAVISDESGRLMFLDPGRGFTLLNVSDPLNPVVEAEIALENFNVNDFVLQGTLLYMAAGEDGVFVWDIKNPETEILMASAETPGDALGIDVDDQHVFVADEFDFAIFTRQPFKNDRTAPVTQMISPSELDRITDKTILVSGTSTDTESGIRLVEVSLDKGESWKQAYGQEQWSIIISGQPTGPVSIRARAVDWSGNIGPETTDVWVYNDPPVPKILVAGFENSHVVSGVESQIIMSALVTDPWDEIYLNEAIVYLNGQATSQKLEVISRNNGYVMFRAAYSETFSGSGQPDYSFVITDVYNNQSVSWPYIPNKW